MPHFIPPHPRSALTQLLCRRAKEKTLAKKAAAILHRSQPPRADPPDLQEGVDVNGSTPLGRSSTAIDSKRHPISPSIPPLNVDDLGPSKNPQPAAPFLPSIRYDLTDPSHSIDLRSGSLLVIPRSDDPSGHRIQPTSDPLARRDSLGVDVSRLALHPYAHLAAASNGWSSGTYPGPVWGHRIHESAKSNSLPGAKAADQYGRLPPSYSPIPNHRASIPYGFSQGVPRLVDTAFVPINHSTPVFTSRHHGGPDSMSSGTPLDDPGAGERASHLVSVSHHGVTTTSAPENGTPSTPPLPSCVER